MTEIRVPTLGESVTEATIGRWFKKPGEAVAVDEPLVELETDKVTIEVPAPAAGVLSEIAAKDGDTVAVGAVLGQIKEGTGAAPAKSAAPAPPAKAASPPSAAPPKPERVVFDGKLVTAAGVSAGIDMALTLVARVAGDEVAQAIQLGIEYDPQPPFDAGSPAKAPAQVVQLVRARSRFEQEEAAQTR